MANGREVKPMIVASLPEETARAARAVFNIENAYLAIGNELEGLLGNIQLSDLDPGRVFPPGKSVQLALMTVFQFAEDMADRAACGAVQKRMDWKYALHLPIEHPRWDPAWLCRFRQPLICNDLGLAAFKLLLGRLAGTGLLGRDKRDVAADEVMKLVCRMNQLDRFREDVSQAIEVLACHQPEMLRSLAQPHWYDRYRQGRAYRPASAAEQRAHAQTLGSDAWHLLQAVSRAGNRGAEDLPEIRHLSSAFNKQCQCDGTVVLWRDASCELCPWLAEGSPPRG